MKKTNDIEMQDLFNVELPPEANLQLADPQLVSFYKNYRDRVLWIDKEIDETLYQEIQMIVDWNREDEKNNIPVNERKKITLMIQSYGGQLDAAFAIIDIMNMSKTPIQTVNLNIAMSAGALIFLNGHKGMRYCLPMSTALIHEGAGGAQGTYDQVQAQNDNYKKLMAMMKANIQSHTKVDAKTMTKWKNKEIYLYAEDQIKYGLADSIAENIMDIL